MSGRKKVNRSDSYVSRNSQLKFRANMDVRGETKGTRPVQEPASIGSTLVQMITHCCRRVMFVDTKILVCTYLGGIFLLSLLAGALPFPRTPLARKDNFLNVYFVKLSWGWTLLMAVPQVALTSSVYCCGQRLYVLKHLLRLVVATGLWLFWTNLFVYFERVFGYCSNESALTKSACIGKGFYWKSMDISGHSFILIYSSLVLIEESRAVVNWDSIGHLLRNEEHTRSVESEDSGRSPLSKLTNEELLEVRTNYGTHTPWVRLLFILTTMLVLVWNLMLLSTVLYFHNMLEKLLAGTIAIMTWYITYKMWFPVQWALPPAPRDGLFTYHASAAPAPTKPLRSNDKKPMGPSFMGMPLNIQQEKNSANPTK